jgi:hypothetical protein
MKAKAVEDRLDEVSDIEAGAEGVRVTWQNGEKKFIGGEIGFELYRRWMERIGNRDDGG